jgi:hypothetical protein
VTSNCLLWMCNMSRSMRCSAAWTTTQVSCIQSLWKIFYMTTDQVDSSGNAIVTYSWSTWFVLRRGHQLSWL